MRLGESSFSYPGSVASRCEGSLGRSPWKIRPGLLVNPGRGGVDRVSKGMSAGKINSKLARGVGPPDVVLCLRCAGHLFKSLSLRSWHPAWRSGIPLGESVKGECAKAGLLDERILFCFPSHGLVSGPPPNLPPCLPRPVLASPTRLSRRLLPSPTPNPPGRGRNTAYYAVFPRRPRREHSIVCCVLAAPGGGRTSISAEGLLRNTAYTAGVTQKKHAPSPF